jgi:hypothetical protein
MDRSQMLALHHDRIASILQSQAPGNQMDAVQVRIARRKSGSIPLDEGDHLRPPTQSNDLLVR